MKKSKGRKKRKGIKNFKRRDKKTIKWKDERKKKKEKRTKKERKKKEKADVSKMKKGKKEEDGIEERGRERMKKKGFVLMEEAGKQIPNRLCNDQHHHQRCQLVHCNIIETSLTEARHQMRSRDVLMYLSLNRFLNAKVSCSWCYFAHIQPISQKFNSCVADRPMDWRTDGRTGTPSYRDARKHLKRQNGEPNNDLDNIATKTDCKIAKRTRVNTDRHIKARVNIANIANIDRHESGSAKLAVFCFSQIG